MTYRIFIGIHWCSYRKEILSPFLTILNVLNKQRKLIYKHNVIKFETNIDIWKQQQQQQLAEMAELPGLGKHCNFEHCKQLGKWFIWDLSFPPNISLWKQQQNNAENNKIISVPYLDKTVFGYKFKS